MSTQWLSESVVMCCLLKHLNFTLEDVGMLVKADKEKRKSGKGNHMETLVRRRKLPDLSNAAQPVPLRPRLIEI